MNRLAAVLLALALAACAGPGGGGPGASPSAAPGAQADAGLLAFTAGDLSGEVVEGETLRGQVVALWFWAPW